MDLCVHESRHDDPVTCIVERTAGRHVVEVQDANDLPAPNVQRRGPRAFAHDDALAPNDEIGQEHRYTPTRFSSTFW